ncbi:MAG TPA: TetR/AcrR family transcriptional regulator [Acidimicrobiales bacterium]
MYQRHDDESRGGGEVKEATKRSQLKAQRRQQLLTAASRLFAERGFRAVSIEDLAAEAGVSGPAVYRHFDSKELLLADLLIKVSEQLLDEGSAHVARASSAFDALHQLIAFHTEFALRDRDLIRIQDHDFASLAVDDAKTVSRLQRAYLEVWVDVLRSIDTTASEMVARTKIQAVFGLLNSTPHSAAHRDTETTRAVLEEMALDAFGRSVNALSTSR